MIEKLLDNLKLGGLGGLGGLSGLSGLSELGDFDLSKLNIPKNIIYLIIAFKIINNLDKIIPQKANPIPDFKNMCPIGKLPIPMRTTSSNSSFMSLFVIFMLIGGAIILANNLLDKINISLMSCGVNSLRDSNIKLPTNTKDMNWCPIKEMKGCPMGKCPMKEMKGCPMGKCPIKEMKGCPMGKCPMKEMKGCPMGKCPLMKEPMEDGKCPLKNMSKFIENCPKMKKCPFFSNELEDKLQKLINEKENLELELLNEELLNEEL
jgi:hypothetical protein